MSQINQHAGADWVEQTLKIDNMSPAGRAAADFLGDVFLGIYHLRTTSLRRVDWSHPWTIEITISTDLGTVDGDELTRIVVLAHDRMLRVELNGIGPHYTRMCISPRTARDGPLHKRCPTLEDHVKKLRDYYA